MLNDKRIQDQKTEFQNIKYSNQIMQSEDNINDQHFQTDSKLSKT